MFNKFNLRIKNILYHYRAVKYVSGKSKFFDLLLSKLIIGVPYSLYCQYGFYNKKWSVRKGYILDRYSYGYKYNPDNSSITKKEITQLIKPYIKRKVIFTQECSFKQFIAFINNLEGFYYKPIDGCGGDGIKKFSLNSQKDIDILYNKINSLPEGLLEETLKQHSQLNVMHPNLLQTIRFTVLKIENGCNFICAFIRTSGNINAIVDNIKGGGMAAMININTGIIETNAYREITDMPDVKLIDKNLLSEEGLSNHPITGTKFKGFKIPYFEESKSLVVEMCKNIDFYGSRLIGFDVAILENGPEILEVNLEYPGICIMQTAYNNIPLKDYMDNLCSD